MRSCCSSTKSSCWRDRPLRPPTPMRCCRPKSWSISIMWESHTLAGDVWILARTLRVAALAAGCSPAERVGCSSVHGSRRLPVRRCSPWCSSPCSAKYRELASLRTAASSARNGGRRAGDALGCRRRPLGVVCPNGDLRQQRGDDSRTPPQTPPRQPRPTAQCRS